MFRSPIHTGVRHGKRNRTRTGTAARLVRFGLVGLSGLVVNQLVLWIATAGIGFHYLVSAVVATQFSTLWNFTLAERWVFGGSRAGWSRRFLWFALMNNAWLVARAPLLVLLTERAGLHYLVSNLIALLTATVARFFVADTWIWRSPGIRRHESARHFYDVHGLARIASDGRLPELETFRVPVLGAAPDMEVAIDGRGLGGLRRRVLVEHSDGMVRYVEHLGRFGFAMEVDHIGTPIRARVSRLVGHSPHVLYTNVVEPLLRLHLARNGFALAHCACLQVDRRGLLITAATDTGKTTTCLLSVRAHGSRFVSDDMVIVGPSGRALAFPKPLTISAHTLEAIDASPLSVIRRAWLQVQSRVHSRSGRRLGLILARLNLPVATLNAVLQKIVRPPKFTIGQLIPGAETMRWVDVSHMVVIERGDEQTESLDLDAACRVLAANTEDAYGFPPYPLISPYLMNGERHTEDSVRHSLLDGVPVTRLRTPERDWFQLLPQIVRVPSRARRDRVINLNFGSHAAGMIGLQGNGHNGNSPAGNGAGAGDYVIDLRERERLLRERDE